MTKPEDRQTQLTPVVDPRWAVRQLELFYTPDGRVYADILEEGYRQTYSIRGEDFSEWLRHRFYICSHRKQTLKTHALREILNLLEAQAKYEGSKRDVHLRLAEHEGQIYLDLGRSDWAAVKIDVEGWRIAWDYPVRFRHPKGLQPLPIPERGGQVDELLGLLNVNPKDWPLLTAWLVAALKPRGPYPILVLAGEQGSGKSNLAKIFKDLIDPSQGRLRSEPRGERDLMIAATNNWVLCFDNLSTMPDSLSDGLCRLSTGGSFGTRTLYSNQEETILEAARPVIITSIEELVVRGDLLDRAICVHLPTISEEKRRTERELFAQYEQLKPKLLGTLFDAISLALQEQHQVEEQLGRRSRMADFEVWAVAAEPGLGLKPGTFLEAYKENREAAQELVLESSPVALAVSSLLKKQNFWEGKATDLLGDLQNYVDQQPYKGDSLPKTPNKLSNVLRRLAPSLRSRGIEVSFSRRGKKGTRIIHLESVRTS